MFSGYYFFNFNKMCKFFSGSNIFMGKLVDDLRVDIFWWKNTRLSLLPQDDLVEYTTKKISFY